MKPSAYFYIERLGDEIGEDETLLASLRRRLINVRKLSWPIRLLLVGVVVQLTVVAFLLIVGESLNGDTILGVMSDQRPVAIPLAIYIFVLASLFAATLLALSATLYLPREFRGRIALAALVVFLAGPLLRLLFFLEFNGVTFTTHEQAIRWLQIVVVVSLAITLTFVDHTQLTSRMARRLTLWMGVLLLAYYGMEAIVWVESQGQLSTAGSGSALFGATMLIQSLFLPYALSVVAYVSGTDIAEWGEALGMTILRMLAFRRFLSLLPVVLMIVIAAVSAPILVDTSARMGLRTLDSTTLRHVAPMLCLALAVVLAVVLFARLARITTEWPARIPPGMLFGGAIFLFCAFRLPQIGGIFLQNANGQTDGVIIQTENVLTVAILLIGLVVGARRLVRARAVLRENDGVRSLLLVSMALLALPASAITMLDGFGPATRSQVSYFDALQVVLTVGAVLYGLVILVRTRLSINTLSQLASVLLLVLSLEVIHWARSLPSWLSTVGLGAGAAAAGVFLLAILWDILTSGRETTNLDDADSTQQAKAERNGRFTLYLAYIVIASTALLFLASLRVANSHTPYYAANVTGMFDALSTSGLLYLGLPMIIQTFLQRVGRWQARYFPATVPPLTSGQSSIIARVSHILAPIQSRAHAVDLWLGAHISALLSLPTRVPQRLRLTQPYTLALRIVLLVAIFPIRAVVRAIEFTLIAWPILIVSTLLALFPYINYGTYQSFHEPIPGPGCTKYSTAVWTYPAGLAMGKEFACQQEGMLLASQLNHTVLDVAFHTPNNYFPADYRVGVTVDESHLTYGCAALLTHYDSRGPEYIEDYVCTDGEYGIVACAYTCILQTWAKSPAAPTYVLQATTKNQVATISVNGASLHTTVTGTWPTSGILVSLMGGVIETPPSLHPDVPIGYVHFRDFAYSPI